MAHPLAVTDYNGRTRIEPSAWSKAELQKQLAVRLESLRDVVVLGEFNSGAPDTLYDYSDFAALKRDLDPDNLDEIGVRCCGRIKNPSPDVQGANKIRPIRVGDPTQATYAMLNGTVTVTVKDNDNAAADGVALYYDDDGGADAQLVAVLPGAASVEVQSSMGEHLLIKHDAAAPKVGDVLIYFDEDATLGTRLVADNAGGVDAVINLQSGGTLAVRHSNTPAVGTVRLYVDDDAAGNNKLQFVSPTDADGSEKVTGGISGAVIGLTSDAYGTLALLNKVKVETGTVASSKKVSLGYRNGAAEVALDNLGPAIDLTYSGASASGICNVTKSGDSAITLEIKAGNLGAESRVAIFDLTQPEYDTVGEIAAALEAIADWTCTLKEDTDALMPSAYLDAQTGLACKVGPGVLTANIGMIVWAINNSSGRVTAARKTGMVNQPANIDWTFFDTAGAYPARSASDWTAALAVIEQEELPGGLIFAVTDDATIQAAVQSWVDDQKLTHNRIWRTVYGLDPGTYDPTDVADVLSGTLKLSSQRNSVVCQRFYEVDTAGVTQTRDPVELAALLCGAAAGVAVGETLTLKRLRIDGLRDTYQLSDREKLESGGVTVLKVEVGAGFKIAFALTSYTGSGRMPRVLSEAMAGDRIEQNLYVNLRALVGTWATKDRVANAEGIARDVLNQLRDEGTISDGWDSDNNPLPAYEAPVVELLAGKLTVTTQANIGGEIDQVGAYAAVNYQAFGVTITA